MANPSVVSLKLPAGVTNGIALAQTPAGAANLNLNGGLVAAGVANLVTAQRVVAVSADAGDTTQILTISGTNRSGVAIRETLPLNGTTQVNTSQDFLTVTNIAISAATVGALTAGTNGIGSTEWVLDNFLAPTWMLAVACSLVADGGTAATYTVEHTYDDPNQTANLYSSMEPASYQPPLAWSNPVLVDRVESAEFQFVAWPIMAHRLKVTAGTQLVKMQSIQAGIGSP